MSTAAVPLFGRRFQLTIVTPGKTYTISSEDDPPLRFTFDVYQRAYQVWWVADISVYNLSAAVSNDIMGVPNWQDVKVTLQAGYQNLPNGYGVIFQGPVFQLLFERENVVDTKLTFHCILGLIGGQTAVSGTYTQVLRPDLIRALAKQAQINVGANQLSSLLSTRPLTRGKVVFGSASKYFTQMAEEANCQWFIDSQGLNMSSPNDNDLPKTPTMTLSPPSIPAQNVAGPAVPNAGDGVIIGTPQQVPGGIQFTALLDARLQVKKPYVMAHIDNSLIRSMKVYQESPTPPELTVLDQDGNYTIFATRFYGDSRGNPWYAEVMGLTQAGSKISMMLLTGFNTNRGQ